jgi:hypothetical protein
MPSRRYRICQSSDPVLTVNVDADLYDGGVYILVADEDYKKSLSRIVYIGMTKGGAKRIAESAANHITGAIDNDILKLEAYAYTMNKEEKEKKSLPAILEAALLARHKERFGALPALNRRGGSADEADVYFTTQALDKILDRHSGQREGFWNEENSN